MLIQISFSAFTLKIKFVEDMKICVTFGGFTESISPGFFITNGFQDLFGSFGIVPEFR